MVYTPPAVRLIRSATFDKWFAELKDRKARVRIAARVDRLARGNPGDVCPVGSGVSEMRINYGPGYRVYYKQRGRLVVLLLCGGNKGSQDADIRTAIQIAKDWEGAGHGSEEAS
jgi:putative addiction module killer protein